MIYAVFFDIPTDNSLSVYGQLIQTEIRDFQTKIHLFEVITLSIYLGASPL